MGILNKFFTGSKGKLPAQLKQADKLLAAGKLDEAGQQLDEVRELLATGAEDEVAQAYHGLRRQLIDELLKSGQRERALNMATAAAEADDDGRLELAGILVQHSVVDNRSLAIIKRAVSENPR
ncbi:MAG TPA: hypothetical protein ENO21_02425, partial [Firmicutes bacterium]|nr:hypothetical protein [Bacillota bacterium]